MEDKNSSYTEVIESIKIKKLKQIFSSKIMISFLLLYVGYLILSGYVNSLESVDFLHINQANYAKYHSIIITGIQIILGLIGVLAIFYLGKVHDYKRDFIKYYGQLYEIEHKIKNVTSSFNRAQFKGMDEWKWQEMVNLSKFVQKDSDDTLREFADAGKRLSSLPKGVIGLTIFILITFAMLFFISFLNETNPKPKDFIGMVLAFFLAIGELFCVWALFEQTIKANDVVLESTVKAVALMNTSYEKLKASLQKYDR